MKKITFLFALFAFAIGFAQDPAAGPTDPPARDAGDVVSFFNGITSPMGDDYTNIAGVSFSNFGSAAVITDQALVDGNTVKKYVNHNFSGIGSGDYDVSQMEMLHVDVYFGTAAGDFRIKLEDITTAATEISVENGPATGQWISYDIPLSSFTTPNLANLRWIVPVTTSTNATFYFDNIYFYRTPVDPNTDASLSALELDGSSIAGFNSSVTDYDFNVPAGTTVVPQITTATPTQAGASTMITQATSVPGTATVVVTAPDMMTTQTYTINIVEVGPSTAAPDPPARDAGDVLSVFTNGIYADIAPSNGTEAFGGDGYDNFTIESLDDTRRITFSAPGDGMQFLYLSNGFDLTDFTHVHIDVFVEGPVSAGQVFTLNFINQPGTGDTVLNTSLDIANVVGSGAWYSADIPLDSFGGVPMSRDAVTLLQLVGAGPSTYGPLYFDNFYFYKFNDTCANAKVIDPSQFGQSISGSNVGATDSGIMDMCIEGADVWYSFTAVQDGEVNMTIDSGFDYGFYSDCSGALINNCNSIITNATANTTYYIRIGDEVNSRRLPGGFNFSIAGSALSTNGFDILSSLKVYPNPSNSIWNIESPSTVVEQVEVYDLLGKKVLSVTPNSQTVEIDASQLKSGLYLAKLTAEGATKTIRLVKN